MTDRIYCTTTHSFEPMTSIDPSILDKSDKSRRMFDECCGAVIRLKYPYQSATNQSATNQSATNQSATDQSATDQSATDPTSEYWTSEIKRRCGMDFSDCCMCYIRMYTQERSVTDRSGNKLSPELKPKHARFVKPVSRPEFILWVVFDHVWLSYDSDGGRWAKFEDVTPGESDVLNAYNAYKDQFECGLYVRPTQSDSTRP